MLSTIPARLRRFSSWRIRTMEPPPRRSIGLLQHWIGRLELQVRGNCVCQGIDIEMLMGRFPEPDVMIDGILAMRHRLDRHDAFVRHLLSRVTAKLAERSFAAGLRRDRQLAFEHDLGKRGHFQIDSLTSYDIYRCSSETAGNLQFIDTDAGLKLRRDI